MSIAVTRADREAAAILRYGSLSDAPDDVRGYVQSDQCMSVEWTDSVEWTHQAAVIIATARGKVTADSTREERIATWRRWFHKGYNHAVPQLRHMHDLFDEIDSLTSRIAAAEKAVAEASVKADEGAKYKAMWRAHRKDMQAANATLVRMEWLETEHLGAPLVDEEGGENG